MAAVVEQPTDFDMPGVRSNTWQVIFNMVPTEGPEADFAEHFREQFSRILEPRRSACRAFFQYIAHQPHYDGHAKEVARKALTNSFWL